MMGGWYDFSHSLTAGMSFWLMCWIRYLLLNLGRRISSRGFASAAKPCGIKGHKDVGTEGREQGQEGGGEGAGEG
jgi:hypothetical protein